MLSQADSAVVMYEPICSLKTCEMPPKFRKLSSRMTTFIVSKKSMTFIWTILVFRRIGWRPYVIGVVFCSSQIPWSALNFVFLPAGFKSAQ